MSAPVRDNCREPASTFQNSDDTVAPNQTPAVHFQIQPGDPEGPFSVPRHVGGQLSLSIRNRRIGAGFQEESNSTLELLASSDPSQSMMERGRTIVSPCVDICAGVNQSPEDIVALARRGTHQCRVAAGRALSIRIGASAEQALHALQRTAHRRDHQQGQPSRCVPPSIGIMLDELLQTGQAPLQNELDSVHGRDASVPRKLRQVDHLLSMQKKVSRRPSQRRARSHRGPW